MCSALPIAQNLGGQLRRVLILNIVQYFRVLAFSRKQFGSHPEIPVGPLVSDKGGMRSSLYMNDHRVSQAIAARLGTRVDRDRVSPLPRGQPVQTAINVLNHSNPKLGDLVEIVGVSSSGKTQLLHHVAADALSKSKDDAKPVVCWFDLNGSLCLKRLQQMIAAKKWKGVTEISGDHILSALRVYHPDSTLALCSSLHSLLPFLETAEGENGSFMRLRVITSLVPFPFLSWKLIQVRLTVHLLLF